MSRESDGDSSSFQTDSRYQEYDNSDSEKDASDHGKNDDISDLKENHLIKESYHIISKPIL